MKENRIREHRVALKMSQTDLSALLPDNPGKAVISLIENGFVLPTARTMKSLCEVFQCKPEDLYAPEELNMNFSDELDHRPRSGSFVIELSDSEWKVLDDGITLRFYKNKEEWFREALRQLQKDCASIKQSSNQVT